MKSYSVVKRNELPRHEKMWRKLRCLLVSERRQSKKANILYNYNNITFCKRQNYAVSKKISDCLELGEVL